jgi:predicted acetyltransferase
VRVAGGADREAMKSTWEAAGRARTGMYVRTEGVWQARLADERATWLVVDGDRGVEGHVAWTLEQAEPEGATTLAVLEMAARSDRATRSLWAAVAAQRDQVTEVRVDVADDDPIDRAFVDPDRDRAGSLRVPHPIGQLALGPMVRIVDIERALLARGWGVSGRLALDVGEGTVVLNVEGGAATLSPSRAEPALTLDRATLAAVAFGGLRPTQAVRFGWLAARQEATLALAEAVLGLPAYFSPERF